MAAPTNILQFKRITVDAISWTAITVPFPCNNVVLRNTDSSIEITLRTNSSDSTTAKALGPRVQEVLASPDMHRYRFNTDDTVVYAQSASGTPVIEASYSL